MDFLVRKARGFGFDFRFEFKLNISKGEERLQSESQSGSLDDERKRRMLFYKPMNLVLSKFRFEMI